MRKLLLILSMVVVASLFNTMAFAAVANDEVTSQKLKEADGTSGQNTNSGSGVKTGHIQNGAVTDAKISGTISQSKITGLAASLANKSDVTHNHDALYQKKYGKVAVVAQSGGDYSDPVAAMNGLASWCGTPSGTNPCLLKIMPGVYDIGVQNLIMSAYVDIEGSGQNVTIIKGSGSTLVIQGASNSEIRALTIDSSQQYGIYNYGASPFITDVTIIPRGSSCVGIRNSNSSPVLQNVTFQGGNAGIINDSGTMKINSSEFKGSFSFSAIVMNGSGAVTYLSNTMLDGSIYSYTVGVVKCIGVFDSSYNPVVCP